MAGVGFLFKTAGGHLQVKDGDTVTLGGGREWLARQNFFVHACNPEGSI